MTTIQTEEPQVVLTIEKHKISLLMDTRAYFSAIPFPPRPRFSEKTTVWGISAQPLKCFFTQPFACSWGDLHFCHSFLIVPETPTSPLRWDLLVKLKIKILLPPWVNIFICP
jgi:hypothetical protein